MVISAIKLSQNPDRIRYARSKLWSRNPDINFQYIPNSSSPKERIPENQNQAPLPDLLFQPSYGHFPFYRWFTHQTVVISHIL